MIQALEKYDDATLIAELESRTLAALLRNVKHASDIEPAPKFDAWQDRVKNGSAMLLDAIERAGVRP